MYLTQNRRAEIRVSTERAAFYAAPYQYYIMNEGFYGIGGAGQYRSMLLRGGGVAAGQLLQLVQLSG